MLLRFVGSILNIGLTKGATTVFDRYAEDKEYWKDKKIQDIPNIQKAYIIRRLIWMTRLRCFRREE